MCDFMDTCSGYEPACAQIDNEGIKPRCFFVDPMNREERLNINPLKRRYPIGNKGG